MEYRHPQNSSSFAKQRTPERKEQFSPVEKLKRVLTRVSEEVNKSVVKKYGIHDLVSSTLHINSASFSKEQGGTYSEEEIKGDEEVVYALDRHNSAADNPNTQQFYKDQHGINTPEGIVLKHREQKEASKSNQAEMIITALMHKVLKERFLVVRASMFDDYTHGIDNLILDKETGAVICAFDEVLSNEGDRNKTPVKIEKIKKSAMRGGTEAKYGISLQGNTLRKGGVRNLPVFYLTLESKDLLELTNDLFYNQEETTATEKRLFAHLVRSIKEQKEMLQALNLPSTMRRSLEGFEHSLLTLESFQGK
jgi:hypothetical protein